MTALCRARVSVDVPTCNAPASSRSDRFWPLCEKHLRMKEDVERRWGPKHEARFVPTRAPTITPIFEEGEAAE